MAIGDIKTFDITYTGLKLTVNAVDMGNGDVKFFITCTEGYADLNALYWGDDVNDGAAASLGSKSADSALNMNGSGVDFDAGMKISNAGLGTAGVNKASYITLGETLEFTAHTSFDNIDVFGVRATSTSTAGGSIKGTDTSDVETLAPHLAINDVTVTEGVDANAKFTISLDHAYTYDLIVTYTTSDGTANDGVDYTAQTHTIIIPAGQTSIDVSVPILDDSNPEPTETFTVTLSNVKVDLPGGNTGTVGDLALPNAFDGPFGDATGIGTILDTDTNGGGSGGGGPTNRPPVAVDDAPACGVEGLVPVHGNVLANDTDPDDAHATLTVTQVNGQTLVFDTDGVATVTLTNGTLAIHADGSYTFTYTGEDIPVDGEVTDSFNYTVSDPHGATDEGHVDLCIDGAAGSPGYWGRHDGSGPQANDWDIAQSTSFESYFGVSGPYSGQWDTTAPVNGTSGLVGDITFLQALGLPNGGGGQNLLAKEATTAVLNFLDEDTHDAFVTAYLYQRAVVDMNNDLVVNDADVLLDLQHEVQGAYAGTGDLSISQLTTLLIQTHE